MGFNPACLMRRVIAVTLFQILLFKIFKESPMRPIFPIIAALTLAGCVSMGTNYDNNAVDRLQVGMSKADVIKALGQPNQVTNYGDGSQRLIWVHSTGSMFGATARSVGLPFSKDGKLTEVPK